MADNKPTFHHLNSSQSQRILWLLEELGIEYELVLHSRNPENHPTKPFLSPPELVATGPYGKAPLLITGEKDGSRYLPESSAIATYLIKTFDTEDKFGLKHGDWIHDEVICSLISTGLGKSSSFTLFLDLGIIQPGEGPLAGRVLGKTAWAVLDDLDRELKGGPKGGYFMGGHPGRCDILAEFQTSMATQRNWVDLKADYPALYEWQQRVFARPAWRRALEKGNGYDLTIFPTIPERRTNEI
ncbi:hypothetical protein BJ875DRAFT_65892 [Amylocarpus encephaloides]|uniref:Glutathione S-transferase n=1 Tax=Amylocarpus encephaloides TaxID=45428 RepID=A0A9P7YFB2_9HELO|nr:hypothetical protein BJ875DRAFT_65892 [Amylocarpus encephaloides]